MDKISINFRHKTRNFNKFRRLRFLNRGKFNGDN
jgi:hypothetical protein